MIKILIVDDEKIARKGIIAIMPWEKFGMSVVGEANSVEKALEFLEVNEVDLIFTDITMPGESGFDLIKVVKIRYPKILFVVLTCHQDFNCIQEVLRLGAIDYIVKTQLEMECVDDILQRIKNRVENSRNAVGSSCGSKKELYFSNKYSKEINDCIINSINYIECNLTSGINQDEASKKANMSKGYFSQCFKEIVGKSFVEYVKDCKMEKAKELLVNDKRPIYWIAEQLGFQDEKYFSRIFREYNGLLPTEYRNREKA